MAHTVALFSVATTSFVAGIYLFPISYIDDREFPGVDGGTPGPFGYVYLPRFLAVRCVSDASVLVNQWLVDGLLVSPTLNSATQVLNLGCFHSCIVATSFMA